MTVRSHHAAAPTRHVIAAIHFEPIGSPLPCTITCDCGYANDAPTAELLDLEWREHRRKVGAPNKVFSDTIRAGDVDPLRRPGRRPGRIMPPTPASHWSPY